MSASIIPGSLIAPHHCHPTLTSALEQRSTLTVIAVRLRWRLFKAMTWWDGGSCTHMQKYAQAHADPTPVLNHLYGTASHAASVGDSSKVTFSGQKS